MLKYYYDIDIKSVRNEKKFYYFKYNGSFYTLLLFKDEASFLLFQKKKYVFDRIPFFYVVNSKYGSFFVIDNDNVYILFKINLNYNRFISFEDLLDYRFYIESGPFFKISWAELWKMKIDYFERYFVEKDIMIFDLNVLANYYIGLGETAITYLNNSLYEYNYKPSFEDFVFSHDRVGANDTLLEWYNPLNVVIDYKARDFAEYLKSLFFMNKYEYGEIEKYLQLSDFSEVEFQILYSRLLFPSYFFDEFESFINEKTGEEDLLNFVNIINEYEKYLKKIYAIIFKISHISMIEWLN